MLEKLRIRNGYLPDTFIDNINQDMSNINLLFLMWFVTFIVGGNKSFAISKEEKYEKEKQNSVMYCGACDERHAFAGRMRRRQFRLF